MRTKTLVQTAIAAAALAWASASFAATPTVPPQPPAIPGSGLDSGATTGNGGLLVAVWDSATGSSLVQWLGLNYNQIGIPDMTTAGTTLDFGTLGGFSTTFADAIGAGQQNRLQYLVVAADAFANAPQGFGEPYDKGLRVSGQANLASAFAGDQAGFNVSGAANSVASFIDGVINNGAASPQACAKANPCSITGNAASPIYFGKSTAGADLGGNLLATSSYAGAVGSALAFFDVTSEDENDAANNGFTTAKAFASQYAGAQWLLNAAGQLVYSVAGGGGTPTVPLPAAGWLLLSGLAGMGVIGRRRKASAEVAA